MNWVILLARNNLHLTRKAIKTVLEQDIGDIYLLIIDNDSTDGTKAWMRTLKGYVFQNHPKEQVSVARAWNMGLRFAFTNDRAKHCLVVNNDIELRPDTYRHLVADGGGFVTAVGVRDPEKIAPSPINPNYETDYLPPDPANKRPHPDFSCYLIRKETWEKVGEFDERFEVAFCEDWDYHCRLHKAGITAMCLDLPYLHHGSMTIKNADPTEQRQIALQAERNRELFRMKWGMAGGSKEYYDFFGSTAPPEPA